MAAAWFSGNAGSRPEIRGLWWDLIWSWEGYTMSESKGRGLINNLPASETPEGKKRQQEYYTALGDFVAMFSRAEVAVQLVLRYYAGLPANRAHILFSGTRADAGIDLIKNLAAEREASKEDLDELTYVFAQLRAINTTRNAILHYGAQSVAEGEAYVRKAIEGVDETKMKVTVFPISAGTLKQMSADLQKIIVHLFIGHMGRPSLKSASAKSWIARVFAAAWLYKPSQPNQSQSQKS
jgi:hypothetical protein